MEQILHIFLPHNKLLDDSGNWKVITELNTDPQTYSRLIPNPYAKKEGFTMNSGKCLD